MGHLRILLLLLLPISLLAGETPEAILKALPKSLGGCAIEEIHTYDQAPLGSSVDYSKPGFLCTVYAYDLGQKNIGEALTDPTLKAAFTGARTDLKVATEKGYYSDLEERDHGTVTLSPGHEVLRTRYHLTRQKGADTGARVLSDVYVFGAKGQIIKLRFTATVAKEEEHAKTIEEMVPAIMDAVRGKTPAK
jgi:hypothetical protein